MQWCMFVQAGVLMQIKKGVLNGMNAEIGGMRTIDCYRGCWMAAYAAMTIEGVASTPETKKAAQFLLRSL
nr:MAG: hypothetical protein E4H34_05605 [Hyphomicrobiales bacterium]